MCSNREWLTSHIVLRLQLGSPLKLRTRLGPQYPHPTTPTTIGFFISPPIIRTQAAAPGRFPFFSEKPVCLAAVVAPKPQLGRHRRRPLRHLSAMIAFIGHDFCWLSNIFEVFIRTDNTNRDEARGQIHGRGEIVPLQDWLSGCVEVPKSVIKSDRNHATSVYCSVGKHGNDPHASCRPWPISILSGKATLLRCSSCSKATIRHPCRRVRHISTAVPPA